MGLNKILFECGVGRIYEFIKSLLKTKNFLLVNNCALPVTVVNDLGVLGHFGVKKSDKKN